MAGRDSEAALTRVRARIAAGEFRITQHAHQEMAEEAIALDDVIQAIMSGSLIEDYPEHRRGPCGLVAGSTASGRPIHVVCSTDDPMIVVITAYEPQPPKWVTPTRRAPR